MVRQSGLPWDGATELDHDVFVHRAILSERYIKNGIRPGAFLRRSKDEEGLSITNAQVCTVSELHTFFRTYGDTCYGAAVLNVGDIRSLELDVRPDPERLSEHVCDHGFITGLPFKDEQPMLAEAMATKLRNIVRETPRV